MTAAASLLTAWETLRSQRGLWPSPIFDFSFTTPSHCCHLTREASVPWLRPFLGSPQQDSKHFPHFKWIPLGRMVAELYFVADGGLLS